MEVLNVLLRLASQAPGIIPLRGHSSHISFICAGIIHVQAVHAFRGDIIIRVHQCCVFRTGLKVIVKALTSSSIGVGTGTSIEHGWCESTNVFLLYVDILVISQACD